MHTSSSGRLLLALDAGTTAVKAAAFNESWQMIAQAEERTCVVSPAAAEREIDMVELANSAMSVLRKVVSTIDATRVAGIALTGQGEGLWLVDRENRPLQNAILWNDGRATEVFADMTKSGEVARIRQTTKGSVHPGGLPVLARWLRTQGRSNIWDSTGSVLFCKDWIRYQLTGIIETDRSDLSRSYFDTATGEVDYNLLSSLGDVPARVLPPIADSSDCRPLTPTAATQLGLPSGLPVGIGTIDVVSVGYAFGAEKVEVPWAIVGTTSYVGVVRDIVDSESGAWMAHGTTGLSVNSLAPMVGTPLLQWTKNITGLCSLDWTAFEEHVRSASTNSQIPLMLPYLSPSGERAPFTDAFARGSFHGLTYGTTSADIAFSAYRGLAQTIAECVRELNITGPIPIAGGGSSSDLLCQLIADASGLTVTRPDIASEAGMLGAVLHLSKAITPEPDGGPIDIAEMTFSPRTTDSDRQLGMGAFRRQRAAELPLWSGNRPPNSSHEGTYA